MGSEPGSGGTAFVFYNRGVPGAEFDTQQENGFFQSKLESTSTLGISLDHSWTSMGMESWISR